MPRPERPASFTDSLVQERPLPSVVSKGARRRHKWLENNFPLAFGIVGLFVAPSVVWLLGIDSKSLHTTQALTLPSLVDACAILAGFQATSIAILFHSERSPVMSFLKKKGRYREFVMYQYRSILMMLAVVVSCLVTMPIVGVSPSYSMLLGSLLFYFNLSISVCAFLCLFRAISLLVQVLIEDAAYAAKQ